MSDKNKSLKTYTVHATKTHLSRLLREMEESGEEIVIARGDKPLARIVPLNPPHFKRKSGWSNGKVTFMSEDFNDPIDDFEEYM